ncbi:Glutathione S-transferase 1-1 [Sarcoptes scabiei]|nr:Glutathione S-transferase 1-1 [Sarcoptes scabiei]
MAKPTFYYMPESPPCRTVMAVARMIGLDMEMKKLNLRNKEHLTPEFLKINPMHKVPTLVEPDGFALGESRAISTYIIQKYKPSSPLYPVDDLRRRAHIDGWLQYDCSTLGPALRAMDRMYGGGLNENRLNQTKETLKTLNEVLKALEGRYLLDDQITVADISMYFSCNMIEVLPDLEMSDYEHLCKWYKNMTEAMNAVDHDGLFAEAIQSAKKYIAEKL